MTNRTIAYTRHAILSRALNVRPASRDELIEMVAETTWEKIVRWIKRHW